MEQRKIREECALQFKLSHPNLVACFGCCEHPDAFLILLEICDSGELLTRLRRRAGWTGPAEKLGWAMDAVEGTAYLHSQGYIHRDIAARNVCLHYDRREGRVVAKLTDLGMTRKVGRTGSSLVLPQPPNTPPNTPSITPPGTSLPRSTTTTTSTTTARPPPVVSQVDYYVADTTVMGGGGLRIAAPWAAPEAMTASPDGRYLATVAGDVWSLAVLFWEVR